MPSSVEDQARSHFTEMYGGSPDIVVMAPGRVNLIGEHTDYQNGYVCPMALEKYTSIAVGIKPTEAATLPVVRCASKDFATGSFTIYDGMAPLSHDDASSWMNYLMGVVFEYLPLLKALSVSVDMNLTIVSDVPFGSGLSSSAALETAMAKVIEAVLRMRSEETGTWDASVCLQNDIEIVETRLKKNITNRLRRQEVLTSLSSKMNSVATTLRCQRAEHVFGGVQCGVMDQYISSCATRNNALMIDCASLESFQVPMPEEVAIIVTKTLVQHSLGDSAYNERVRECNDAVLVLNAARCCEGDEDSSEGGSEDGGAKYATLRDVNSLEVLERSFKKCGERVLGDSGRAEIVLRRARHVVSENSRVISFRAAMLEGNFESAGRLMYESHTSLEKDYEVSCVELNELVEISKKIGLKNGVYGARMTGGGFGGCTVTMVRADRAHHLRDRIEAEYLKLHPEKNSRGRITYGRQERLGFVSKAGRGAGILTPIKFSDGYYSKVADMPTTRPTTEVEQEDGRNQADEVVRLRRYVLCSAAVLLLVSNNPFWSFFQNNKFAK